MYITQGVFSHTIYQLKLHHSCLYHSTKSQKLYSANQRDMSLITVYEINYQVEHALYNNKMKPKYDTCHGWSATCLVNVLTIYVHKMLQFL